MSSETEHKGYQSTDLDISQHDQLETLQAAHPAPPPPHTIQLSSLSHLHSPSLPSHTSSPSPCPQASLPQSDNEPPSTDLDGSLSSAVKVLHGRLGCDSAVPWGGSSRSASPSAMPKLDQSTGDPVPVARKAGHDNFPIKGELPGRLKQEHVAASPTKEGQLQELLMIASLKTSADDTASQTLLQLAGQTVTDLKAPTTCLSTAAQQSSAADSAPGLSGRTAVSPCFKAGMSAQAKTEPGLDSDPPTRKVRHKKRMNGSKICLVCGDRALAHNFDVITCESCKAFFRRNALKSQNLQRCMFQNNCTIDKNTRRFCPSCRLKKCFAIGMKAELMLDEEERRLRREKKAQRTRQQTASSTIAATENGGEFLVESSSTGDNSISLSADTSCSAQPGTSFPAPDPAQQQAPLPSHRASPLPSFHSLQDSVRQSSSASSQSSPCGLNLASGMSPGMTLSQPTSAETSPFSSLLTQLSASSPGSFTAGLAAAQQNAAQVLPQSGAVFPAASPGYGASPGMESSFHRNQQQGLEVDRQERQEGESLSPCPETVSSPMVENIPRPFPGPAARIFKHVPRDQLPSDPFMYWIVSSEERLMLANLTNAYQEVLLSLPERSLCRNMPLSDSYFIQDFLNEIDDAMYKIVQFSKHIADFRQMRKEDQIAMLKSSAMHTFGIACCAAYVHERDCWLSLRGDLTSSHLRKLTNDDPYIQVGVEYCRSVKALVKNDFTIYALIHCMILFDPRDAKIVDRQMINQTRDKYVIMLKHYLEAQYSYLYANEYFVAIQERVREIIHLAKSGNAMFKRYSSAFQPLITEMLSS